MRKMRLLILVNLILFVVLIFIAFKENYFQKLTNQKDQIPEANSTEEYKQEISLYKYYRKKGRIVMLGNSITYRCNWNELFNRNDILNRGIPSDITAGFLERINTIIEMDPAICFILGGINDLQADIKKEQISRNLINISKKLSEQNILPVLVSILPVASDYADATNLNKKIIETNALLKKACEEYGMKYLEVGNSLIENGVLASKYSMDGIHLTGLAYSIWAELMLPIIDQTLITQE